MLVYKSLLTLVFVVITVLYAASGWTVHAVLVALMLASQWIDDLSVCVPVVDDDTRGGRYHALTKWYLGALSVTVMTFPMNNLRGALYGAAGDHAKHTVPLDIVYVTQTAFYAVELARLFVLRPKKVKDMTRMVMHHILTLGLLLVSKVAGYQTIGVVILLIHDPVDIFLYAAQGWQRYYRLTGRGRRATTALWVAFVAAFVALRVIALYLYIRYVATNNPGYSDCSLMSPPTEYEMPWQFLFTALFEWPISPGAIFGPCPTYSSWERGLVRMLILLWFLQLTWFVDIVRMIRRMVTSGDGIGTRDVREEAPLTPRQIK